MEEMAVCGLVCSDCPFHGPECQGCAATKGRPFWAVKYGLTACPIYDCAVNQKGYTSCGQCQALPCNTFTNLKDPNMTDEAFQQVLKERIYRLKAKQS
jgi:hypothetical protein